MIAFKEFMWSGDQPNMPNRNSQLAARNTSLQGAKLQGKLPEFKPAKPDSKEEFKAGVLFGMRMRQSGKHPDDFPEIMGKSIMFRKGALKGFGTVG